MRIATTVPPAQDDIGGEGLVLRDGTTATVRPATPDDRDDMRRFFASLSPESLYHRFFAPGEPTEAVVAQFCDAAPRSERRTLVARRTVEGHGRIIAVASYAALTNRAAEVGFAVGDPFQGKGIGTLLFERLAAEAAAAGFQQFHASTRRDNAAMLDVFRDSGFEVRSKTDGGFINLELSLTQPARAVIASERRRRGATVQSLTPLIAPRSIAIIGASSTASKMGARLLQAVVSNRFAGTTYAVHASGRALPGARTFRSARQLPPGVDLAVVAVPAGMVAGVVDDCAAAGVRSLVVITAGFAEKGEAGRGAEAALLEKVRGHGMRMVGPNCLGLVNLDPATRLNASLATTLPEPGRVALGSQSGALGIAVLGMAKTRQLGISSFVSIGNKADVSSNDLLEYWEDDPRTAVVLLYLESFGNPRQFARIARRFSRAKPIVALKAGRTHAGSLAATSHTAALSGSDSAVDALFRQAGVVRADTVEDMFDIASVLDAQPLPRGHRLAIVTNAGGPGILAADACEAAGLTVAQLSAATRERLEQALPGAASLANPIDLVASAGGDAYRQAIEIALAAPDADALLVIVTTVDPTRSVEILEAVRAGIVAGRAQGGQGRPVVACLVADARPAPLQTGEETIPVFAFPENAVRALGKMTGYAKWRERPDGLFWTFDDIQTDTCRAVCRKALAERGEGWLKAAEISGVLHALGVTTAASALAHSADEAAALASVIGFPVAAKLASATISHKTELGAVRLNLTSPLEVRRAFTDITTRVRESAPAAAIDGVLVQAMVTGGVEALVGISRDPAFGALVGFGLGGVDVEVSRDVSFRVAPLTDRDAEELLREIRGVRLLEGHRGRNPADLDALAELLLRVSRLAEDVPEIAELDFNPVMALAPGKGCRVVDARIRVRECP